ncbi:unnamed protein product [Ectocarpus fasciculatus]
MAGTFTHVAGVRELGGFEVAIMNGTNTHPNIVQLIDVLASKGKIFAVMERVDGGDLFDAIVAEGRLEDENLVHHYFRQLLDAIEHCHSRGICHRDIKPENVLLNKGGVVKLTGFALAGLFDPSIGDHPANLLHTTCGTPDYIAPEVIQGAGYDGRPVDLWSAGVTLYTMLAGFLPFEADSLEEKFARIRAADFKRPPEISMSAWSLLEGLLEPNPRNRYTMADVRLHSWMDHRPSDRFTTPSTAQTIGSGENNINPCSSSSSSSSSSSGSACGGGVEGADSFPKLSLDICKTDDDGQNRGTVGEGRHGRDTVVQMDVDFSSYSISGSRSDTGGGGLPNSTARSDMIDSHSSYPATLCSEGMETRYSSDESSGAANWNHESSRPRSTSPSPSASASVIPSDSYRRLLYPPLGLTDSLPPASSASPPSSISAVRAGAAATSAVACKYTWADVMGKNGGREEADRPRARESTLRGRRWRRDEHRFSRRRRAQDQCLHPAALRSPSRSEGSTEEEGVWAETEGMSSSSTEEIMKLHHSDVVNFGGGFETEVHHLGGCTDKAVIGGEHFITPKTERNTPGTAWSCAERNATTDAPKKLRSFFSGNALSPSRQLQARSSPWRRQQQNATDVEKRAQTWSEGSPSIVFRRYQALGTSPGVGGGTGSASTRMAVISPASPTAARLLSLERGTRGAARDAALVGVETQQTEGMATATSVPPSSSYSPARSVSSSTISHWISRLTSELAETRMSMRRLGPTRLLLSLPESEPLSLAKALQRSLEDQCGCVCLLLPNPKRVAHARVKACRTIVPSLGEETIVSVVLSVLFSGFTPLPIVDGFGDSTCRDGNERGIVDIRRGGRNDTSGGSSRSGTSTGRGQGCGPAANGPDARSTDVLIALNAGPIEAFDSLVEDLLSLTDGRWRAGALP